MIIETVNTLEENQPQYRLGDAVLCRDRSCGEQAFAFVAANRESFEGTVFYEYARRIDRSNPDPQWGVLKKVVAEKSRQIDLEFPGEDELVIHLRMGDWKGFKLPAERLVNYVMRLMNRLDFSISKITIVTAIHFGELLLVNQMSGEQVSLAIARDTATVKDIIRLFLENGQAVRIQSSREIERDFCFLANSRLLVLGNGHFSLSAAMVSSAECFIPPWARRGSKFNIDEMLASRIVRNLISD